MRNLQRNGLPTAAATALARRLPRTLRPWRGVATSFVVAQLWAFLLCAPHLVWITSARNRFYLFWSPREAALWLACTLLAGWALLVAGSVLRECSDKWHAILVSAAGLLCSALLLWENVLPRFPAAAGVLRNSPAAFILGVALAGLACRRGVDWQRCRRGLAKLSLFLAPVMLVFWGSAFTWPSFGDPAPPTVEQAANVPPRIPAGEATPGGAAASAPTDNVYIFVLDAWSYRLTFPDGRVAAELPHLRDAAERMCVFTDAHSPGCVTAVSMPRLVFQRSDSFTVRGGDAGFADGETFRLCGQLPNLFTAARQEGYRTYMIGWYLPYPVLLGDSVDIAWSACRKNSLGTPLVNQAETFYWNTALGLLGSQLRSRTLGGYYRLTNRGMVAATSDVLRYTQAVLGDPRSGQFAVFHWPVPHLPFCFQSDGPKSTDRWYNNRSPKQALGHLSYADSLVGRVLAVLKAAGKYDRSTIVFTSDHTWWQDPEIDRKSIADWTHVPLLVKFPGQQEGRRVAGPVSTGCLERFLRAAAEAGYRAEDVERLAAGGQFYRPLAPEEIRRRTAIE